MWRSVLVLSLVACGSSEKSGPPITRDRDSAAVVIVKRATDSLTYIDEAEPNDASAQQLSVPGGVRGNIDGEADVDVYQFAVTEPGWLEVKLSGIEGVDLILELRAADGAAIARSDRGPAKTGEGLPNRHVSPGSYQLAVSEFVKKRSKRARKKRKKGPRTGPSPSYQLSVRVNASEPRRNHEREPNEGPTEAMELLLGVDGFGYVGWRDDRDRWRLTLDNFGDDYSLDVDVAPVSGLRLKLAILDDNGDVLARRTADKGQALAIRNLIPKKGDDHVYLEVSGRGSNHLERYALRMNSRLLSLDEEREPNDGPKRAMAISTQGKASSGSVTGFLVAGDQDWFALEVAGSQLLTVSVKPPAEVDATLTLARADGTTLGEANGGKAGEKEVLSGVPVSGRVLLQVHGKGTAETLEPYELRWSVAPSTAAPAPAPAYDPYQ